MKQKQQHKQQQKQRAAAIYKESWKDWKHI